MQTAQGGEWVMRWKVEFPFLLKLYKLRRRFCCQEWRSQLKLHGTELILIGDLTGRLNDGLVWDYSPATSHLPRLWMFFVTRLITTRLWHTFSNGYYKLFWVNILLMTICTYTRNMIWTHVQSLFNSSEGWSIFNSLVDIMYQVKLPLLIIVTFTADVTWLMMASWHFHVTILFVLILLGLTIITI